MRWVVFLQRFNYVFKHKLEQQNKVTDALHRRYSLVISRKIELISLKVSLKIMLLMKTSLLFGQNCTKVNQTIVFSCKMVFFSKGINCVYQKGPLENILSEKCTEEDWLNIHGVISLLPC